MVGQKPLDVVEGGSPLLDGFHDVGEVVIEQHQVGGFASNIGAGLAHGHPNIGLTKCRRIIDAIAGHRHDGSSSLESASDAELLFGSETGDHHVVGGQELSYGIIVVRELGADHHCMSGEAGLLRNRHGGGRVIPGDHHDLDPGTATAGNRIWDFWANRVGHPDETEEFHLSLGFGAVSGRPSVSWRANARTRNPLIARESTADRTSRFSLSPSA